MPYILSKVQIYTLLYVGYWLKETVSKCLNYWGYGRYLAAPFSHCKVMIATWSTIVALISSDMHLCPWPLLPLPLFCFCALHPLSEFVTLVLSSVYTLSNWRWDAPLSYFRELVYNWLIYILFISESLDSLAQFSHSHCELLSLKFEWFVT